MAPRPRTYTLSLLFSVAAFSSLATANCNGSSLNTSSWYYSVERYPTTLFDVAQETRRGVCDIGHHNLMADVTIIPNIGQQIWIPTQVCDPDNETCLIPENNATSQCIYGGPRLYYTVNGDTYGRIAQRLNITVESLMEKSSGNMTATTALQPGQFVKDPLCEPSQCILQPYTFSSGVYKDLADKYGTTVGQIMMLSPTYNYSTSVVNGESGLTIDLQINCTTLLSNITIVD
jgi:hypothetical protein